MSRGSSDIEIMARGLRSELQQSAVEHFSQDDVVAAEYCGVESDEAGSCGMEFGGAIGAPWPSPEYSLYDGVAADSECFTGHHACPADDGGEDFEWFSSVGSEAAYCQAATESHNASIEDGVPGGSEAVPTQFKGQGSVMYSYHECGKMRLGTLNIRGSLCGASEVCA